MSHHHEQQIERLLRAILCDTNEIVHLLKQKGDKAKSAKLIILDSKGNQIMPATIHVNGNGAKFTFTEFDWPERYRAMLFLRLAQLRTALRLPQLLR